jgi:hypothetical protein
MNMRRDALAGSAEMMLAAERIGRTQDGMVATVGIVEALPGAGNIIPGRVKFTVDLRCMDDATRKTTVAQFENEARTLAAARKLNVTFEYFHDVSATVFGASLQDTLAAAIGDLGHRHPYAVGSRSRREDDGKALFRIYDVRALSRRHHPQPRGILRAWRHGAGGGGADSLHRALCVITITRRFSRRPDAG